MTRDPRTLKQLNLISQTQKQPIIEVNSTNIKLFLTYHVTHTPKIPQKLLQKRLKAPVLKNQTKNTLIN
jgi:hypothetical protein